MAKATKPSARKKNNKKQAEKPSLRQRVIVWLKRAGIAAMVLPIIAVVIYSFANPPVTPYMVAEAARHGGVTREWVDIEDISPHMTRAAVAAEDANFCLHWGFDMSAIRAAIEGGAARGGSTISQQTVKNAYLWQGRSWVRKGLEAFITPVVELVWSKRRILEVYLNIAEFDTGVFGVQAASQHYFGRDAADLTAYQAGLLAAVLPNPKERDAAHPSANLSSRAERIADGAATIAGDERSECFDD